MDQDFTPIKVAVAGANGKMGQEAVRALRAHSAYQVVSCLVRTPPSTAHPELLMEIPLYTDVEQLLMESKPDVWLDFTDATSVVHNVNVALRYGVRPVIGATGYTQDHLNLWEETCQAQHIGAIAAPNFAIGALLMIRFASVAAQFYQQVEIVELHHDGKRDAPSGTARRTAEAISAVLDESRLKGTDFWSSGQAQARTSHVESNKKLGNTVVGLPSRGLQVANVPVHSIRLPGLVAHQEVMFGGEGEVLTIRHDSMARNSFMPGVLFACSKVMSLNGLIYGLENLLW